MNGLLILLSVGLAAANTNFLQCYKGGSIEKSVDLCRGSCLTVFYEGEATFYCSTLKVESGCHKYGDTWGCFCNKNLCNHKNGPEPPEPSDTVA